MQMKESINIRLLTLSDWYEWKQLRLHGATNHPNAFDYTFQELAAKPDDWYQEQITNNIVFAAFSSEEEQEGANNSNSTRMIGCIGFVQGSIMKQSHRGEIGSVYLRPECRGLGIGKLLFEHIINYIREHRPNIIQLHLSVGKLNASAVKLYQSIGFEIYGTEPRRLIGMNSEVDGLEYIDEYLMWMKLK